jgi:hypothetical protein
MVYTTHKFMVILGMVYGFGVCQILILSTVPLVPLTLYGPKDV